MARADLAARISALPKVELHVHLEGALSPETVLMLADRNGVRLPWQTPEQLRELYRFRDFEGFRQALLLGVRCLRKADDFVLAVRRLGEGLAAQNVRYAEVSITPQFYADRFAAIDEWLDALNAGRAAVARDAGVELRWIPDIVRSVPRFARAVAGWACSKRARDGGVVALGLAGPEQGHPAAGFAEVFRMARERGLPSNPHAGEGLGPQSVRDALAHLRPSRIGHGVGAARDPALMAELAESRIALEVCVTSNLRLGHYPAGNAHPLRALVESGCTVTLNTDDPELFGTDLGREYLRAVEECGLSERQLAQCVLNAVLASYLDSSARQAMLREFTPAVNAALGDEGCAAPASVAVAPSAPIDDVAAARGVAAALRAPGAGQPRLRIVRRFDGPNPYLRRAVLLASLRLPSGTGGAKAGLGARLERELARLRPAAAGLRLDALAPLEMAEHDVDDPGEIVARVALLLQRWAGVPVRYAARLQDPDQHGDPSIVLEHCLPRLAGAAGEVAAQLVCGLLAAGGKALPPAAEHALLGFVAEYVETPIPTIAFLRVAVARGLAWRLVEDGGAFLDLGQGNRQRRVWRHFTDATSEIATVISTRKDLANAVMRAHGLPVPRQLLVRDEAAAVQAARTIGHPVVVKPVATDYGTAVHLDLATDAEVAAAFKLARPHGAVLIEEQLPGFHHRLMVIDGRLASGRRQMPAHVVGDGRRTVRALVDASNEIRAGNGWKPIPLDAESGFVLGRQGLDEHSVPEPGALVRLRTQGNLSTGGTMELLTDRVHPDNARAAVRAAAIVGLDVAGVDFITPDIERSWTEAGGGICEINATPGFIFDEEALLVGNWFANGDSGRIATVVVLDPPQDGHVGACAARLLGASAAPVAHSGVRGVRLDEALITPAAHAGDHGALIALTEPSAASAVLELRSDEVARLGVQFDRCAALIVPADAPRAAAAGAEAGRNAARLRGVALSILAPGADLCIYEADEPAGEPPPGALGAARLLPIAARGPDRRVCPVCAASVPGWEALALQALAGELPHMLLRYCPPTSNSASVI
ncbi:MAG: adenosine deaminase [Burkholderiaceae bacterium]|nr:adenosine deaminase [Burkholderiaceae bacterium]